MAYKTQVASVHVDDLDLALRAPFGIAGGSLNRAENLLVTVELHGGVRGYGEAAPFPAFNGETRAQVRSALLAVRERIVGVNVRHWRKFARELPVLLPSGAARCAIETAILDAFARYQKVSLWRYLGGHHRQLRTDFTITTGAVEEARRTAADAAARGFQTLKLKVGGGSLDAEVERVRAVRAAAPASGILLDANGAYTADAALALLDELRRAGIKPLLFEQPVARADLAGLARVRREGRVIVAADESAGSPSDVRALISAQAAQVVNIKLMKSGLHDAMEMAWLAREAGLKLMVGGLVESSLAMSMSACFAAGTGGFSYIDLDTPLFMTAEPLSGGLRYEGDIIKIAHIKEGHGVSPIAGG